MAPDERDGTVGVDPVTLPQLADEPERVTRPGAAAAHGERGRAWLDRPAPRVERGERDALLRAGNVEGMRSGSAEEVLAGRPRRWGVGLGSGRRAGGRAVELRPQPLACVVDPLAHALGIDAGGARDLLGIRLRRALDRSADLVRDRASRLFEALGAPLVVGHESDDGRREAPQPVVACRPPRPGGLPPGGAPRTRTGWHSPRSTSKGDEDMGETYQLIGAVRGEPLAAGRVGARLRVPLTGTPGPHWSRAFSSYLAQDLTGHCAVGHLHLNDVVQGSELVLEGVEPGEAPALGECLERAVDAANRAC